MDTKSMRFTRWMTEHVAVVVIACLAVTAALAVPFLTMQPEGSASQEPAGEVFEARDLVDERFQSAAYDIPFIMEARDGDLLRKEALLELIANTEALRDDPEIGPKLFSYLDPARGVEVHGVHTLADAIDDALRARGVDGVAGADQAQITAAAGEIIDAVGPGALLLSGQSERDASGGWVVPAMTLLVLGDDAAVGGPPAAVQLGLDDTTKEEFNREVQTLLRGDEEHFEVWGVGFDVTLTSEEQGQQAGPFIGLTVLAVLLVVGAVYRSYWPVAVSGAALAMMIIWLRGLANLVGMEQDQILATIVPIAMISFGIDFVFHAYGRYREERALGKAPRASLTVGMAGVLGALVLALSSDTAAFLSNTTSGIQSIVQFGIAAAFGLLAAFLMLGLVTPLVLMRIDERVGDPPRTVWARAVSVIGSGLAASGAMAAVLLSMFLAPAVGVVLVGVYLVAFILVPALVAGRLGGAAGPDARPGAHPETLAHGEPSRSARMAGAAVAGVARYRGVVLPAALVVTGICAYYAVQVPARFDVKDFFTPTSDFVVSLDKIDEHGGVGAGEPAVVYVEGDLTAPSSIAAMDRFTAQMRGLDGSYFGRADNGEVRVEPGITGVLADAVANPVAAAAIESQTGVAPVDGDGDGYPDAPEQVAAVLVAAEEHGVALDGERLAWTPDDVAKVLWQAPDGDQQATVFRVYVAGTREQESIAEAEEAVEPLLADLRSGLREADPDARAILTGSPVARQHSLDAVSRALQVSLPIAVLLCLLIAAAVMRSLRYALVSIVPIILVVAWLYAFMYAFGFNLNIVTATIGAISIGIGIDYAIHFTMRYREEQQRSRTVDRALRASGESTGVALVASAASSIVGFTILAFAPMPLFASYGLLTAVMIVMALGASLLVLPSLLAAVTRDPGAGDPGGEPAVTPSRRPTPV